MFDGTVLGAEWYYILWFFYIYSVLGVVVEMIFCYAQEGVIESRIGLLYLPLSPIYGFGGAGISLFLFPYISEPAVLFVAGIVIGTMLEYLASFILEKAFGAVFWDYSSQPLNLHGRVCLRYSIYWGFLSLLLLYVLDKWAYSFVELFPRPVSDVILTITSVLALASTVLTLAAFRRFKHKVAVLTARQRGEELAMKDNAGTRLVDRLVPDRIMINTFPRMSLVTDYMELTGEQRRWIRLDGHFGHPSEVHQRMRQRAVQAGEVPS